MIRIGAAKNQSPHRFMKSYTMRAFLFFPQRPISYWTYGSISVGELARG
jgi:hypothetical protein